MLKAAVFSRVLPVLRLHLGWLLCLLLGSTLAVAETPQQSADEAELPRRVYLATMAPGDQFWSVFGHNALLLEYDDRPAESYNFGYFDFDEPGFLSRFAFGAMEYLAVVLPASRDLGNYSGDGRAVWLQELALDASQRQALAQHLREHMLPQNRRYLYDYFRNNCSTKVRDALDLVTDGAFTASTSRRSHGYTWRGLALAQSRDVWWMYLAMHAGLGQAADATLSIRDESYIPALLMEAVREVRLPDAEHGGRPLVRSERILMADQIMPATRTQPPLTWFWFLAAGLLWMAALLLLPRTSATMLAWSTALLLGLGGAACVFFWFFTAHWGAADNQNLLLFNPLYLLLALLWLVPAWRSAVLPLAFALLALGCLGSFAKVLPAMGQQNIEWVLALLPLQWGIWRVAFRNAQPRLIASSRSPVA